MDRTDHSHFRHSHDFVLDSSSAERRTRVVIVITATMMVIEITAGVAFNSMALLVDGWHMGTHVTAFLITALAYYFSRRHAANPLHSFGTAKIGVLGGFASAVVLAVIALLMAGESVHRFFVPLSIHFNEAIGIAVLGLAVNLVCALVLTTTHILMITGIDLIIRISTCAPRICMFSRMPLRPSPPSARCSPGNFLPGRGSIPPWEFLGAASSCRGHTV